MAEISKIEEALKLYNLKLDSKTIEASINKILNENFDKNNTKEVYKQIYSCLDLTTLNSTDTKEDIWKLTEEVNQFEGSADVPNVAAICIYPNLVETAKEALTADVNIACVSAGFPTSQTFIEVKIAETALAVASGADEIDIVLSLSNFFEGNYEELTSEIEEIKHACKDAKLKVILETGALKTLDNIKIATLLALYSGADFVKTSTGKGYEGATLEAAYVICDTIKEYSAKTGQKAGFKASGGVSTVEDAVKYYTIVENTLDKSYLNKEYFRIGTSRLAKQLLAKIEE